MESGRNFAFYNTSTFTMPVNDAKIGYEPGHSISYKTTCARSEDLDNAVSAGLRPEDTKDHWMPTLYPTNLC